MRGCCLLCVSGCFEDGILAAAFMAILALLLVYSGVLLHVLLDWAVRTV